ncbi:hypothetical protein VTJ49DRAFT_3148 [Mycothermus thermophilus]|uniref:Homeobox domain-containing protein n=1 Tax=Humicola insolens TaxID=85995 RepID=A0ABR3V8N8_HUMIN
MEFMDPFRRRYTGMTVQPYAGQPPAPQPPAQYPYWNLMAYYQHQHHRAAALMGQGGMHLTKPAEPKPRLAKEEVELLEREFAKNQKPSSSTKRELAEQMGVEVPRINVGRTGEKEHIGEAGSPVVCVCVLCARANAFHGRTGSKTAAQRRSS